jgi:hypothetical protein
LNEDIDGIFEKGTTDVNFTRQTIRNARLNGGWAKGIFYHEGSLSLGYDQN